MAEGHDESSLPVSDEKSPNGEKFLQTRESVGGDEILLEKEIIAGNEIKVNSIEEEIVMMRKKKDEKRKQSQQPKVVTYEGKIVTLEEYRRLQFEKEKLETMQSMNVINENNWKRSGRVVEVKDKFNAEQWLELNFKEGQSVLEEPEVKLDVNNSTDSVMKKMFVSLNNMVEKYDYMIKKMMLPLVVGLVGYVITVFLWYCVQIGVIANPFAANLVVLVRANFVVRSICWLYSKFVDIIKYIYSHILLNTYYFLKKWVVKVEFVHLIRTIFVCVFKAWWIVLLITLACIFVSFGRGVEPVNIEGYRLDKCVRNEVLGDICIYSTGADHIYLKYDQEVFKKMYKNKRIYAVDSQLLVEELVPSTDKCKLLYEGCSDVVNPEEYYTLMKNKYKYAVETCPLSVLKQCNVENVLISKELTDKLIDDQMFEDFSNINDPKLSLVISNALLVAHVMPIVTVFWLTWLLWTKSIQKESAEIAAKFVKVSKSKNNYKYTLTWKSKLVFYVLMVLYFIMVWVFMFIYSLYLYTVYCWLFQFLLTVYMVKAITKINGLESYFTFNCLSLKRIYRLNKGLNSITFENGSKTHLVGELPLVDNDSIVEMFDSIINDANHFNENEQRNFLLYYLDNYIYKFYEIVELRKQVYLGLARHQVNVNPTTVAFDMTNYYIGHNNALVEIRFADELKEFKEFINTIDVKEVNYREQVKHHLMRLVISMHYMNGVRTVQFVMHDDLKPFIDGFVEIGELFTVYDNVSNVFKKVWLMTNGSVQLLCVNNGNGKYTLTFVNDSTIRKMTDMTFSKAFENVTVDANSERTVVAQYKDKVNPVNVTRQDRVMEHSTSHALSRMEHFTIRQFGVNGSHKRVLDVGTNFCGTVLNNGIVYNCCNVEGKDFSRLQNYQTRIKTYIVSNPSERMTVYFGDITEMNLNGNNIDIAYMHNCVYNIDLMKYSTTHVVSGFSSTITNTQLPFNVLNGQNTYDVDNQMDWSFQRTILPNYSSISRSNYQLRGSTANEFHVHNVSILFDWFCVARLNLQVNNRQRTFKSTTLRKLNGYYTMQWVLTNYDNDQVVEQLTDNTNYKPCVLIDDDSADHRQLVYFSRDSESCRNNMTETYMYNGSSKYPEVEQQVFEIAQQNCGVYKKVQTHKFAEMRQFVELSKKKITRTVIQFESFPNLNKNVVDTRIAINVHDDINTIDTIHINYQRKFERIFNRMRDISVNANRQEVLNECKELLADINIPFPVVEINTQGVKYRLCNFNTDSSFKFVYHDDESETNRVVIASQPDSLAFKLFVAIANLEQLQDSEVDHKLKKQIEYQKSVPNEVVEKNLKYRDELGNVVDVRTPNYNSLIDTTNTTTENVGTVTMDGEATTTLGFAQSEKLGENKGKKQFAKQEMKKNVLRIENDKLKLTNNGTVDSSTSEQFVPRRFAFRHTNSVSSSTTESEQDQDAEQGVDQPVVLNNNENDSVEETSTSTSGSDEPQVNIIKKKKPGKQIALEKNKFKIDESTRNALNKNVVNTKNVNSVKNTGIRNNNQALRKPIMVSEQTVIKKAQFDMHSFPFSESTVEDTLHAAVTGEWKLSEYRTAVIVNLDENTYKLKGLSKVGVTFQLNKDLSYFDDYNAYINNVVTYKRAAAANENDKKTLYIVRENGVNKKVDKAFIDDMFLAIPTLKLVE